MSSSSSSSICQSFVQNAWRKDICSNCFQMRDEHKSDLGECNNTSSATATNGTISNSHNSTTSKSAANESTNPIAVCSNDSNNDEGNKINNNPWSSQQKFRRIPSATGGPSSANQGPSHSFSKSAPVLGILRNVTTTATSINGTNKLSVTNSTTTSATILSTTTKGHNNHHHIQYPLKPSSSGIRNSIHNGSNHNIDEVNNDPVSSTDNNNGASTKPRSNINVCSEATALSKSLSSQSSSSLLFSTGGATTSSSFAKNYSQSHSHLITSQQQQHHQGKGVVMTNQQHPSKSDNNGSGSVSVIPPLSNQLQQNNNDREPMTSSTSSVSSPHEAAPGLLTTTTSVSSSFIASKNIFNNTNNASSNANASGFITTTTASSASNFNAATTTGSTTVSSVNSDSPSSSSSTSGCNVSKIVANANAANIRATVVSPVVVSAAGAGSSGLSHSQSANSIKRGNINVSSSSLSSSSFSTTLATVLGSSSSEVSSSQSEPTHKSDGSGVVGGFDVVITCNSGSSLASENSGGSHHNSNEKFDNCVKNGVIENPCNLQKKKKLLSEGVSSTKNISNINVQACESNSASTKVVSGNKTSAITSIIAPEVGGMNRAGKIPCLVPSTSSTDGELIERRKVGFSSQSSSGSGGSENKLFVSKNGKMEKSMSVTVTGKKGILRNRNGSRTREKNVRFPEEVVKVIGYGGGPSGISDDEDDTPTDPLDSASVAEVMEKSASTSVEKELNRLTQKNTNFNSIKTNLLGTTCIEIGPIVGCTGGKSMEGSSKPLVSIGTFEARKEPLRIRKKISEDSADDELNEKTVEKHRKFIQRSGGNSSGDATTGKTLLPSALLSSKSVVAAATPSSTSQEVELKKQQQIPRSNLKAVSHPSASSLSFSSSSPTLSTSSHSTTTAGTISYKTSSAHSTSSSNTYKSSSSTSNQISALPLSNKRSGSAATTIEVNPEQVIKNSRESLLVKGSSSSSISSRTDTNSSSNITRIASKWGGSGGGGNTTSGIPTSVTSSSSSDNPLRNIINTKPVLKRIQQQKNNSNSPEGSGSTIPIPPPEGSSSSSSSSYTVNAAVIETNNNNKSIASGRGNNELVILTNGNSKNVGGNGGEERMNSSSIASKRSSFLRDIIVDSSKTTTIETAGGKQLQPPENKSGSSTESGGGGVNVICKNNGANGNPTKEKEPVAALIKSELKVDLKPSLNNGKLSHPPFGECLSNRSNGTDDSSEFDDSLEDSGLDIKKCSEISESDEKSGSGSDSGNENDYSERDRVKIISSTNGPKSGLYISVDEVEGTAKSKPEKLSPDSVLFSSASEMSASGSSESIPEALDTVSNSSSQKSSESKTGPSASVTVKRAAPRPPPSSGTVSETSSKCNNQNTIYANSQQSSIIEVEELYDDVSFYKNPMHFTIAKKECKTGAVEEVEEEEENIYDDCNTITSAAVSGKGGSKSGNKSSAGSYSFANGSRNALDSDGEEEEKVVHRRNDGIEFIGIRKIDSESFLRERSPTPDRSPDGGGGKRERSSSASPKTRRKVNQFFSTIGKRAGAAFSQHMQSYSSKNKSNPVIEEFGGDGIDKSPSGNGTGSAYKRSHSTDEVSMTRTQEIYATLTPTSFKLKGLAPVLHKLSKIDLNLGEKDQDEDGKEKGTYKKHKLSSSIKKFLRFGSKDGSADGSFNKYDFGNCQNKTEMISEEPSMTDTSSLTSSMSRTPTPTTTSSGGANFKAPERKPSIGTISGRPPPPPPPRVHSLDLLNRVGVVGPNGTVRPARPPPPARHNKVAPSFTSVFNNVNPSGTSEANNTVNGEGITTIHVAGDVPDPNNPPSKPKRKNNADCVTANSKDLETTYNHITTLNLETLKLIASQTPTKIRRSTRRSNSNSNSGPLKWSQFHINEPSKPLVQGDGFVFYSASLDDESCVLLIQESATAPNFSAPFEFPCVETSATFEDSIPSSFITWKASEYVTNGSIIKVFVSVMPKYYMYTVENYMRHSQVPLLHKYFALLQAMNFWDKEDMSDLLVLVQNSEDSDYSSSRVSSNNDVTFSSPSSVLVYVHPIPHLGSGNASGKHSISSAKIHQISAEFEIAMKKILLTTAASSSPLLGENDHQVLLKRLNESPTKSAQDQFRLFLQVKLFTPKRDSEELERIKKLRSERAIQQWLDRERALCMKEAVEQTLQRNVESSISPYKRSYLEFLLTPENSAKAVLDMLIDLLE